MKYSHFEGLALAVGGSAILGTLVASWRGQPMVEEIIAQFLLLAVLVCAVHWGRNGGFASAVLAIVIYIAMRAPLVTREGGLTPDLVDLLLVHTLTFGFVGIVGGEVCGRVKYLLARAESSTNVDYDTQVYNQRFIARIIENSVGQHVRYGTPFSIGILTLNSALTSELRPARRRSLVKTVANHVRNDVRLVDDVGRLDDGRFVLLFPQTPKTGGRVATERVRTGARDLLGARDESVTADVLGAPEDLRALQALVKELLPEEPEQSDPGLREPVRA